MLARMIFAEGFPGHDRLDERCRQRLGPLELMAPRGLRHLEARPAVEQPESIPRRLATTPDPVAEPTVVLPGDLGQDPAVDRERLGQREPRIVGNEDRAPRQSMALPTTPGTRSTPISSGSGGGVGGSPPGQGPMASSTSRRSSSSTGPAISSPRRGSTGIATTGYSRRITSSGRPSRRRPAEHRQAARRRCRRACGQCACRRRLRRLMRQTALQRHLADCLGQAHGTGGGGVSARVPELRRRHPAEWRRLAGDGSLRTGGSQAGEAQDGFARGGSAIGRPILFSDSCPA